MGVLSSRPISGEACPELVEGGLGDDGNAGICKRDMLPFHDACSSMLPLPSQKSL